MRDSDGTSFKKKIHTHTRTQTRAHTLVSADKNVARVLANNLELLQLAMAPDYTPRIYQSFASTARKQANHEIAPLRYLFSRLASYFPLTKRKFKRCFDAPSASLVFPSLPRDQSRIEIITRARSRTLFASSRESVVVR